MSAEIVGVQTSDDNIPARAQRQSSSSRRTSKELTERALAYLEAGYAVHFAGPAGTGENHPCVPRRREAWPVRSAAHLIHGDDEFGSSDLIGRERLGTQHKLIDNFIHSILEDRRR